MKFNKVNQEVKGILLDDENEHYILDVKDLTNKLQQLTLTHGDCYVSIHANEIECIMSLH